MSILAARSISLPGQASPTRRPDVVRTLDSERQTVSLRLPWVSTTEPEKLPIELLATVAHSQRAATQAPSTAVVNDLSRTSFGPLRDHDSDDTTGGGKPPPPTSDDSQTISFERFKAAQKDNRTLWGLGLSTVGFIGVSLVVHLTDLLGEFKKPAGLVSDSISIFLATCFGAGLLSLKNGTIDSSSDHTYSNS